MIVIFEGIALLILILGIVSAFNVWRDVRARRERALNADVQDGMPDEIPNLPSRADGSTENPDLE